MAIQKQYHLLLVADDPDQSDLFTLVLERAGYRVTAVETGEEALEQIAALPFDLILTDYMLPDFNGDVLIERVRQQGIPTKIVMMSNHVDVAMIARQSKADAFYRKDDIFQLVRLVESLLPPNGTAVTSAA
ncbi:MAG: response regulator [Armatimonadota bacterium]